MKAAADFAILKSTVTLSGQHYEVAPLVTAFVAANSFIIDLGAVAHSLNVELWRLLNQRNLSGFIGTIAVRAVASSVACLEANPHPDGQPDLVYVGSAAADKYFRQECFLDSKAGGRIAQKARLCPYRYGGLEVKSTIGDNVTPYASRLRAATGKDKFDIGVSRVSCIRSLTYWAHHRASMSLLGLYYDYYAAAEGQPQILAAFLAQLDEDDWGVLSTGKPSKKKTSNTGLTARGREKVAQSCIAVIRDAEYVEGLRRCGVSIPPI